MCIRDSGGMTSHAAVVARGMGKCCVSGAGALNIDYKARTVEVDGVLSVSYTHLSSAKIDIFSGFLSMK